MRSIYVPLPEDAARKLAELARREYRAPREQATVLILDGLRRADAEPERADPSPAERQAPKR